MQPQALEQLQTQIDAAHTLAASGRAEAAVYLFAAARDFATHEVDQVKLDAEVARQVGVYHKERETYRKDIAAVTAGAENKRPLVLIGDSLGLPRPKAKDTPRKGAEHIYPSLLGEMGRRVDAICQRFFTVGDAKNLFENNPELGRDSDVVIHLGLNDTARRMFLERQRIAMQFVPKEVGDKIVGFAQKFRKDILKSLPALHYTPPEDFTFNLGQIFAMLKARNAHRIVLTTIILPPQRTWHATPDMALFFGIYNVEIMTATRRYGGVTFDFDRHAWSNLHQEPLDPDGMHLSPFGHQLFARELEVLLR